MKSLLLFVLFMLAMHKVTGQACPPIDNRNVGGGGTHATICFFNATNVNLGCLDCQLAGASGWKCDNAFNAIGAFHHATIDGVFCQGPTTLPLELLDFSIQDIDNGVKVNWTTNSERDNDYFVLEKSRDGSYWEEVAKATGEKNSTEIKNYELIDSNPFNGVSYYRLSQFDIDGKSTQLAFESVDFKAFEYLVYPIPVNKTMFLEGDQLEENRISVINSLGETVEVQSDFMGDKLSFNFAAIKNGVYFLVIESDTEKQTKRITVVH